MSNYQPYEGSQGDPWSTEPVQEPSRGRGDKPAESFYDQSPEVLARMPDLDGDGRGDSGHYSRRHSHGHGGHRRSSRPSGSDIDRLAPGITTCADPIFLKITAQTKRPRGGYLATGNAGPNAPWLRRLVCQRFSSSKPALAARTGFRRRSRRARVPVVNDTPPTADWISAAGAYAKTRGFNRDSHPNLSDAARGAANRRSRTMPFAHLEQRGNGDPASRQPRVSMRPGRSHGERRGARQYMEPQHAQRRIQALPGPSRADPPLVVPQTGPRRAMDHPCRRSRKPSAARQTHPK